MSLLGFIFAASSSFAVPVNAPTDTLLVPENLFSLNAGDTFEITENGNHHTLIIQSQSQYLKLSKVEFEDPVNGLTSWFVQNDEGEISTNLSTSNYPRSGWNRGEGRWELIPSSTKGAPAVPYSTIAKCSPLLLKETVPDLVVNKIEVTQNGDLIWQKNALIEAKPCDKITFRSTEFTETFIIDSISMYNPENYLWGGHIEGRKFAESRFWMSINDQCHVPESSKSCWEIRITDDARLPEKNKLWFRQTSDYEGDVYPISSFWHNRHSFLNNRPIAVTALIPDPTDSE